VRSRNAFGLSAFSDVLHFRTFDLRQTTSTTTTSTSTQRSSENNGNNGKSNNNNNNNSKNMKIETVTPKPVTPKPVTKIGEEDQFQQTGVVLERGASSEPLSTRRNQGKKCFSLLVSKRSLHSTHVTQ
jgi:hypothetical protein